MTRRREFIAGLVGAVVLPTPLRAQQTSKLPTIGLVGANTPATQAHWTAAFVLRLRELGWTEHRTVAIEYRWAEGRVERFDEFMVELVRLKVDVIVTVGVAVEAAKRATSVIPIVFALANDPLGTGLVDSLSRPGGNVTGFSNQASDLGAKRLEILREIIPNLRRLAIMANVGNPQTALEMGEVQAAARAFGLDFVQLEIRRIEDIAHAFNMLKGPVDALYVCPDPLITTNRTQINALALSARLPTIHGAIEYAEAGGLISYGANYAELWRRAGDYVDKILRGVKPADLPVEQPTKFELVVNLNTAKALGIEIPSTMVARADRVIE